jgi:hypothetical protein
MSVEYQEEAEADDVDVEMDDVGANDEDEAATERDGDLEESEAAARNEEEREGPRADRISTSLTLPNQSRKSEPL